MLEEKRVRMEQAFFTVSLMNCWLKKPLRKPSDLFKETKKRVRKATPEDSRDVRKHLFRRFCIDERAVSQPQWLRKLEGQRG
jgi:hypothetical protein